MDILQEMDHFYYKMALHELQVMNTQDQYHGLSYNSMLYINVLSVLEPCTLTALASALHITKSAVTIKINELVKAGAVEKVQSEEDRRVFYVRLSKDMKQTIQFYDDVFTNIAQHLQNTYKKEELELFSRVLHHISSYDWRTIQNE